MPRRALPWRGVPALALLAAVVPGQAADTTSPPTATRSPKGTAMTTAPAHPYVGLWVTADGHVRHELLPNGRYDEARGRVESAYRGRYEVTGHHIDYVDDTGFTADGDFRDGVLYHGGMVLRRIR